MRKIILVDEDTGEKIGDYKQKKKIRKKNHSFYLVYWESLAGDGKNVTTAQLGLIGEMDFRNRIAAKDILKNSKPFE